MTTDASAPAVTRLDLKAPLTGVIVPIEQVPDPVFAQKMVGEGVSIDPLSDHLLAPCDGEIIHLHPAAHAVTIRTLGDLEVLVHIGLDTVKMRGEGFTPKVKVGDQVRTGDELIAFDLDKVATAAKSLLTQVVIANSDQLTSFTPRAGLVTAGVDAIAEAAFGGGAAGGETDGVAAPAGRTVTSDAVVIPNPTGLHARPAAVLSQLAQKFESTVQLKRGDDKANAKSVMAIMGMEVYQGQKIQVVAHGPDAAEAAREIAEALREGLGEEGVVPIADATVAAAAAEAPAEQPRRRTSDDPNVLLGVAASPGLGVGKVLRIFHEEIEVKEDAADRHRERRILNDAIDRAMVQIEAMESALRQQADPDKAAIFAAHREILRDPTCSTSPPAPWTRARPRRSPGAAPIPPTRTGSPTSRTSCSPSARRTCATSASGCWRRSPASAASGRRSPRGPCSSPRTSRRRTPRRWTGRGWRASARWPAGPRRTSPSSPGRSTSPPSPGSSHGRWRSTTARW
jgi:phosphocarrier protein FPr